VIVQASVNVPEELEVDLPPAALERCAIFVV
jgi:hypothetical protein